MTGRSRRHGFGEDSTRYGFAGALAKHFTRWRVKGDAYRYRDIKAMRESRVRGLLQDAIREGPLDVACWLFDELRSRSGDREACMDAVWEALEEMTDGGAIAALESLRRTAKDSGLTLGGRKKDARANFLLGRLYLNRARTALHSRDSAAFRPSRNAALRYLEKARDLAKAEARPASGAGKSTARALPAVGKLLEQAMYLKWPVTRPARKKHGKKRRKGSASGTYAGGE